MSSDGSELAGHALVTGGCGFIGSALVKKLISSGRPVINVDNLTYAANPLNLQSIAHSPLYNFQHTDICDGQKMTEIFRRYRPTTVFHLAAETHVDRSIDCPAPFIQTNVVGTGILLDVARSYFQSLDPITQKQFRFVLISTDEVFGALDSTGVFDRNSKYDPSSPYAASKAAADHLARAWYRTFSLPTIITNCGNNFGPHQFPEKLIPLTILNGLKGHDLPVYGQGLNIRDWIYVDDHVAALECIGTIGEPGETYLIGAGAERRNIDVVRSICEILDELAPKPHLAGGHTDLIRYVADRPGHDFRYAIDASFVEQHIGWRAQKPFHDGLRETVSWYLSNQAWCNETKQATSRARLGLAHGVS